MPNEVAIRQQGEVFVLPEATELRRQLQKINEFQMIVHETLTDGQDFGVIPGTDKPTLLKPGAEKIAKILGLSDEYEIVDQIEDWEKPLFRYLIRCKLVSMQSGVLVSSGMGECNSYESKYRYRNSQRKCPNCGKETIIPGKKEWGGGYLCWKKKGGCEAKFEENDARITQQVIGKIENDDVFSLINTILKMATKRALVAATLSAGRLSNVFTQDIEDMPGFGEVEKGEDKKAAAQQPPFKTEKPKTKTGKVEPAATTGEQKTDGAGDPPPFDQPAGANREPAEGSDAWIVAKIKSTGVKEAGLINHFVNRYGIPTEKIDTITIGNNLKLLSVENKADLTILLKTKEKQLADARATAEKI